MTREISERYLGGFYLPDYATGTSRARFLIIVLYWAAAIWAAAHLRLQQTRPQYLFAGIGLVYFVALSFGEATKSSYYRFLSQKCNCS